MTDLTIPRTRFSRNALGIALMALGAAAMMFALFGLGMTWFQEWMVGRMPKAAFRAPQPGFPTPAQFVAAMRAVWTVWRTHLPIWFLGGITLIVTGRMLRAVRRGSVGLARLCCALALVAIVAYAVDSWVRAMPPMAVALSTHPLIPTGSQRIFFVLSMTVSSVGLCAPFVILLWGLRCPKQS